MKTQTIQQTAKKWKALQAIGAVALIIGLVAMFASAPDVTTAAIITTSAGLILYLVGRIAAWWHHG